MNWIMWASIGWFACGAFTAWVLAKDLLNDFGEIRLGEVMICALYLAAGPAGICMALINWASSATTTKNLGRKVLWRK